MAADPLRELPSFVGARPLPVTFYLAPTVDLAQLEALDPDRDLAEFRPGELAWVAQTYLRLRQAGFPVALSTSPPEQGGLVVFHAKQKHALARASRRTSGAIFVAIRADNSAPLLADFEILQTGKFADGRNRFWVPFWPQPGLLPRDPARGNRVERVAYMGRIENLHPDFRGEGWRRALAEAGFAWVLQEVRFERASNSPRMSGAGAAAKAIDWEDYRSLDVVLAVRPDVGELRFAKPASKLINAWRAGVPALVGPEWAYREIRRAEEEFVEVTGPSSALAALHRLRAEPESYARMVAAGRRRLAEFSYGALTQLWAETLFEKIPAALAGGALPWSHRLPLAVRLPLRRGRRLLRGERAR